MALPSLDTFVGSPSTTTTRPSLDSFVQQSSPTTTSTPVSSDTSINPKSEPLGEVGYNIFQDVKGTAEDTFKDIQNTMGQVNTGARDENGNINPLKMAGAVVAGAGKSTLTALNGVATGIGKTIMDVASPFIPQTVKDKSSGLISEFVKGWNTRPTNPEDAATYDKVHALVNNIQQKAQDNPEVASTIGHAINLVLSGVGVDSINLSAFKSGLEKALSTANDIIEGSSSAIKNNVSDTISGVKNFITDKVGGKTAEQILATSEKDVPKLGADEQKLWYKNKAQIATDEATKATASAKQASEQSLADTKKQIEGFQQELGKTNRDTAISLKKPSQQLMKNASSQYVELTGEAADGSPALKKTMAQEDLSNAIDSKFEYSPEIGESLKSDLGIEKPATPTPGVETPVPKPLTNQQILDKAREIMQTVSKTTRSGGKVYSPEEYQAMQKYSFLMEQLGGNGVDMSKANQFWKEWVPMRDRIVREIKPFDETNTGKMPITTTLQNSEATATTAKQAATQLDAKSFISNLEKRMKLPEGTIGKDTRDALQKVDQAKLRKINIENVTQKVLDSIKTDKVEALKSMSLNQYNTLRAQRINGIIKKTLIGFGIIGAAKATGLDKTILNAASSIL